MHKSHVFFRAPKGVVWLRGVGLSLAVLVSCLLILPVQSASNPATQGALAQGTTPLNVTIYLSTAALQPVFQQSISQQIPTIVNQTIDQQVSELPTEHQSWSKKMAQALLQPSASLTSLTPRQGGLATTLNLQLYPGDPKPLDVGLLITLSVHNPSTMQVSAAPLPGSPSLINGPLTTMAVPIGQLLGVTTTPACGENALAVKLNIPLELSDSTGQQTPIAQTIIQESQQSGGVTPLQAPVLNQNATVSGSHIEIPASSLSTIGSGIGSLSLGNNLFARNIRLTIQGSQLVSVSDITLGESFKLGEATTLIQPAAAAGKLAAKVEKTTLAVFSVFNFAMNNYNQQIEQQLNNMINTSLAGKFTVSNAFVGKTVAVSCAGNTNSLMLAGELQW